MRAAVASTRLVLLSLLLAACTDQPTEPYITLPPAPAQSDALACNVDVRALKVGCDPSISGGVFAFAGAAGPRMQIIGGQGINVRLTSSNISYDSVAEIFRVDVTVQNLTTGWLGTYHGDDVAGIHVFFQTEPVTTAGQGEPGTANTDGADAFTATQQVYYKYAQVLEPGETTRARTWEFHVPRTVQNFGFSVYVEAPLIPGPTPPEYGIWQQMSSGFGNACGLVVDGRAFCWGRSYEGALGYGGKRNFTDPVAVAGGHRFTTISTAGHSCAVTNNHDAYCWGSNDVGQIGAPPTVIVEGKPIGNTRHNPAPSLVLGGISWKTVDVGPGFSCGLSRDGEPYCWGGNGDGQLGTGSNQDRGAPAAVMGGHVFTSIVAGTAHACGLKSNGEVWCWGNNRYRALGTASAETCGPEYMRYDCALVPVRADTEVPFVALDAGGDFTCALSASGVAYCWGRTLIIASDDSNPPLSVPVPTPVPTDERFAKVFAGGSQVCGLRQDGQAFCWGSGTINPYGGVTEVAPGFRWRELRPGHNAFRCGATLATGEGYCWGQENTGQLGNGGHHEEYYFTDPQRMAALHVRDMPPIAGFSPLIGGREVSAVIYEPLWNADSPLYSDDDFGLVKFYWSYGDGATSEGRVARHSYAKNGTYPVTLTVEDTAGQRAMYTEWVTAYAWEGE
ncbi:PKD domain-containing protein [Longimicrobium sp.]|uniref:PKD domain-containing protein n=1 Tax=Longimicrobium sp. TaxID=2029185 RepID=UPI003B3A8B4E